MKKKVGAVSEPERLEVVILPLRLWPQEMGRCLSAAVLHGRTFKLRTMTR
jgi:hypothetical protein